MHVVAVVFQFLIGSLEASPLLYIEYETPKFQFLIGSLEARIRGH